MRDSSDKNNKVVDIPIHQLKPEYYVAFKELWTKNQKPIDKITNEEWDVIFAFNNKK